jgi:hypothetical protein
MSSPALCVAGHYRGTHSKTPKMGCPICSKVYGCKKETKEEVLVLISRDKLDKNHLEVVPFGDTLL